MAEPLNGDINSELTVRVLSSVLREVGLDPVVEARELGLDLGILGPIPRDLYNELWRRAVAASGPDLGLRFAERLPRGSLGVLEWGAMSAPRLGEGLSTLATYGTLLHTGGHYEVDVGRDDVRFIYLMSDGTVPPRAVIDWSLGYLVRCVRRAVSSPVELREVRLQYPRPDKTTLLEATFEAPLTFDAARNELVFPKERMDEPLIAADPEVHASLRAVAVARAQQTRREPQIVTRVRGLLTDRIAEGVEPTITTIASDAGVGVRTLQRRLGEEETGFRELVKDARLALAARWLKDPSKSVSEIAYAAGYGDPSAFARAFKRRHGVSPAQFRKGT